MNQRILLLLCASFVTAFVARAEDLCRVESPDGFNHILLLLDDGQPFYCVERKGRVLIENSPVGVRCSDADFGRHMSFREAGPQETRTENYQLVTGN